MTETARKGLLLAVALAVTLAAGFALGRASGGGSSEESITGVVQGLDSTGTAVALTPDGGTGTSYNVVPDAEGVQLLKPEQRVVLRLGTLPNGSQVVYRVDRAP